MATGKYKLQTNNDWNAIFYRFKQGKQFDIIVSTNIKVPKGRWSDIKQEILATPFVDFKDVNIKLKEFDTHITKEFENSNDGVTVPLASFPFPRAPYPPDFFVSPLTQKSNVLLFIIASLIARNISGSSCSSGSSSSACSGTASSISSLTESVLT